MLIECCLWQITDMKSYGVLNLIDLAGSERVGKSGATGARLEEVRQGWVPDECTWLLMSHGAHSSQRNKNESVFSLRSMDSSSVFAISDQKHQQIIVVFG